MTMTMMRIMNKDVKNERQRKLLVRTITNAKIDDILKNRDQLPASARDQLLHRPYRLRGTERDDD